MCECDKRKCCEEESCQQETACCTEGADVMGFLDCSLVCYCFFSALSIIAAHLARWSFDRMTFRREINIFYSKLRLTANCSHAGGYVYNAILS